MPLLVVLLAIPIAAGVLLWSLHRSRAWSSLVPTLVLSGLSGAILTSCFAFMSSTMPIAPYEMGARAWGPLVAQSVAALIIGFGISVLIAAAVGVPFWYFSGRARST